MKKGIVGDIFYLLRQIEDSYFLVPEETYGSVRSSVIYLAGEILLFSNERTIVTLAEITNQVRNEPFLQHLLKLEVSLQKLDKSNLGKDGEQPSSISTKEQ
ncbi:hypothetical protein RF11_01857 [Thelohanellus kitauei]|uniref:Uncharacterized protein n=1 Tax=Thelohanellus kitauei TaxID=669202 RepID=A0A0C2J215_THEKT|nr:hypothetical protein RF11_01857 [Thelohanellus kitauei]